MANQSVQTKKNIYIHATAVVSDLARIGDGTRIWHHCQIRENAQIGTGCILGKGVYVDFGVRIGDNVKIQNGSYIYHGTTIDSGVFVGPSVVFTNDKLPRAINPDGTLKSDSDWEVGQIRVCFGASVGTGAIVLPEVTIGKFAMVGAGAIVTHDVPDHAIVVGNPARQIGYVCSCGSRLVEMEHSQYICPKCQIHFVFNTTGVRS